MQTEKTAAKKSADPKPAAPKLEAVPPTPELTAYFGAEAIQEIREELAVARDYATMMYSALEGANVAEPSDYASVMQALTNVERGLDTIGERLPKQ